jgi:hypothetical protein
VINPWTQESHGCPQEAISLLRDPTKSEQLKIQKLIIEAAKTFQD